MSLLEDLPFLLRLVDDPSPRVRAKIATRLRLLGSQVWSEIERATSSSPTRSAKSSRKIF